jgi:hypothetical protein
VVDYPEAARPLAELGFDLLRERPEVQARNVTTPEATLIRQFIGDRSFSKSNDGLRAYISVRGLAG